MANFQHGGNLVGRTGQNNRERRTPVSSQGIALIGECFRNLVNHCFLWQYRLKSAHKMLFLRDNILIWNRHFHWAGLTENGIIGKFVLPIDVFSKQLLRFVPSGVDVNAIGNA